MMDQRPSDAAKINALLHDSAVRGAMQLVARDMQLKEFIRKGSTLCEEFRRTEATLHCKGPFGWAEAIRKRAVLRSLESQGPVHAEHFARHLDAAAHALFWAVYGPPDKEGQ